MSGPQPGPTGRIIRSRLLTSLLFLAAGAPLVAVLPEAATGAALPVSGLDHVIVVVADLDAASARYQALGFVLKPGRVHPNGIRNRHVKFPDGTEVELLTVDAATDGLAATYAAHLAEGEGPVYAGFHGPDLEVVAGHLTSVDWPLRRSGGLLTIDDPDLGHVFFGRRNRSPTDRPEHFRHANGARRLTAVWWAAADQTTAERLLRDLGAVPVADKGVPGAAGLPVARVAQLPEGEVHLLPGTAQVRPGRPVCGVTVAVTDLAAVRAALTSGGIAPEAVVVAADGSALAVRPEATCGLWLEFRVPPAGDAPATPGAPSSPSEEDSR